MQGNGCHSLKLIKRISNISFDSSNNTFFFIIQEEQTRYSYIELKLSSLFENPVSWGVGWGMGAYESTWECSLRDLKLNLMGAPGGKVG